MAKDRRRSRPERRLKVLSGALCECGCGEQTFVAMVTDASKGWVKGRPKRFRKGHAGGARESSAPVADRYVVEDRSFETSCWVWLGRADHYGYGRLVRGGRYFGAHRVSYIQRVGPIPAGYELHHRCEVKLCVNPAHLVPLTPEEHGKLHEEARRAAC